MAVQSNQATIMRYANGKIGIDTFGNIPSLRKAYVARMGRGTRWGNSRMMTQDKKFELAVVIVFHFRINPLGIWKETGGRFQVQPWSSSCVRGRSSPRPTASST